MWQLVDVLIKEIARQRKGRQGSISWKGDAILVKFRHLLNSRVEMREM